MSLLLDLQGFQGIAGTFIVKELACVSLDNSVTEATVKFFQPPAEISSIPQKYRTVNNWLEQNYHGLSWRYGDVPYEDVRNILKRELRNFTKIYVKGREKKEWLKDFFYNESIPTFINLDEFFDDCPPLGENRDVEVLSCPYHCKMENMTCAVRNVLSLKKWLSSKIMYSMDKSIRLYYELRNLVFMEAEDIAHLPKSFVSTIAANDVHGAWEKLSDEMKIDEEISQCRRCWEHHNSFKGYDVFDGLPPMIKDCGGCRSEENY